MIDVPLFIAIGLAGVIITIIIYVTGKNKKFEAQPESDFGYINLLKISVSIILLVYLFRLAMVFLTGLISGLYIPVIIGGIFALIPLILIILTKIKSAKSRV